PFYHRLGKLPRKRHTIFRQPSGELYHEHVMGSRGFSGPESLLYHLRRPTSVLATRALRRLSWEGDLDPTVRMRHFQLNMVSTVASATIDRTPLLYNADVAMEIVRPTASDDFF